MAYPGISQSQFGSNVARYRLGGQNRNVYDSMGQQNPQQAAVGRMASGILNGAQAPRQGDISGFSQRFIGNPTSMQPPNARGLGGFTPSGTGPVPHIDDTGMLFVPAQSGRRHLWEEGGAFTNASGRQTVVGRTQNGGLSLTGTPGGIQARASEGQLEYAQQKKDDRVLRNARKYGLGTDVPAVAAAVMRAQQRFGMPQQGGAGGALNAQGRPGPHDDKLNELVLSHFMDYLKTLPSAAMKMDAITKFRKTGKIPGMGGLDEDIIVDPRNAPDLFRDHSDAALRAELERRQGVVRPFNGGLVPTPQPGRYPAKR